LPALTAVKPIFAANGLEHVVLAPGEIVAESPGPLTAVIFVFPKVHGLSITLPTSLLWNVPAAALSVALNCVLELTVTFRT
jgi:hypothetical protein